jgi:hypothetical protein
MEAGGESYEQIPCLNAQPKFIEYLADCVRDWQNGAYQTARATEPAYVAQ